MTTLARVAWHMTPPPPPPLVSTQTRSMSGFVTLRLLLFADSAIQPVSGTTKYRGIQGKRTNPTHYCSQYRL
jgi:hypothetical protein